MSRTVNPDVWTERRGGGGGGEGLHGENRLYRSCSTRGAERTSKTSNV
jgi:hypothetical protein